jgi:hypothetical protein
VEHVDQRCLYGIVKLLAFRSFVGNLINAWLVDAPSDEWAALRSHVSDRDAKYNVLYCFSSSSQPSYCRVMNHALIMIDRALVERRTMLEHPH